MTETPLNTGNTMPDAGETYRGWSVSPAYYGWSAISPNYDASWEGEEDGWVDNGEKAWGLTRAECLAAVDEWFDENTTQPSAGAEFAIKAQET